MWADAIRPRGVDGISGRRERTLAWCDVVGQQRARLSKPCPSLALLWCMSLRLAPRFDYEQSP
jgi:hypothetical protein